MSWMAVMAVFVGRRLQKDVGGEPKEHSFGNLGLWGLHIPGRERG